MDLRWQRLGVALAPRVLLVAVGVLAFGVLALPAHLPKPWLQSAVAGWALASALGLGTVSVALLMVRPGGRRYFLDAPASEPSVPWWALGVLALPLLALAVWPGASSHFVEPLAPMLLVCALVVAGGRSPRIAFAVLILIATSTGLSRLSRVVRVPRWWGAYGAPVDWHASFAASDLTIAGAIVLAGLAWRHRRSTSRALLYGPLATWSLGAGLFERGRSLDAVSTPRTGWMPSGTYTRHWALLRPSPSIWEWLPLVESLLIGGTLAALAAAFLLPKSSTDEASPPEERLLVGPAALVAIGVSQLHWSPEIASELEAPAGRAMLDYVPTLARGWTGALATAAAIALGFAVLALMGRAWMRRELRALEGLVPKGPPLGQRVRPRWLKPAEVKCAWGPPGTPYRERPSVLDGPESVAHARRVAEHRIVEAARRALEGLPEVALLLAIGFGSCGVIAFIVRRL